MTAIPSAELTSDDSKQLDEALTALEAGAVKWAALSLRERAQLLEKTHATTAVAARAWAEAAVAAKKVPAGALEGEEWMSGPYAMLGGLQSVAQSVARIAAGGSPLDGIAMGTAPGGRVTVKVLPANLQESLILNGFSGEVWLKPGVTEAQARANAGLGSRRTNENGGVGLVLGAGNITSIGPLDVLYELVAFNRAAILKLNPTFATLLPAYAQALAPLIEFGVVRIVNGGAAVGGYLAQHEKVKHVHITGSGLTHDLIVWGSGEEAAKRRAANDPQLKKPISSELGGVSPTIIVPGNWSKADLRFQAENVASQRLHNCGHNCIATQALILSSDWAQKDAFLAELRDVLDTLPARAPWYPGSDRKLGLAEQSYPAAEHHGGRLLIEVNEKTSKDLFTTEYFAPVLGHTAIPGTGAEFLRAAVKFANEQLDGTLGASLIVDPADRDAMGAAFDEAIAELRYGAIGINVWSAIAFLHPNAVWGAFPGHTLQDVKSGIGVVHNGFLIADAERTVLTGPFRPFPRSIAHGELSLFPKPPWFVTARSALDTGRALTSYGSQPGWLGLPGIFAAAFRA